LGETVQRGDLVAGQGPDDVVWLKGERLGKDRSQGRPRGIKKPELCPRFSGLQVFELRA